MTSDLNSVATAMTAKRAKANYKYASCPSCGLAPEAANQSGRKSTFSKHCYLCRGPGMTHQTCLICQEPFKSQTDEAKYAHYKSAHQQIIGETNTIHDIHREFCPEDYPDLDFNHGYGSIYSRQSVLRADAKLAKYWKTYIKMPSLIYHDVRDIVDYHREAFFDFFGMDPISIHGHVSDVQEPHLLTSVLLYLKKYISELSEGLRSLVDASALNISDRARKRPRFAVASNSYSTGFGPSAYDASCPWSVGAACGDRFYRLDLDVSTIDQDIEKAKVKNCVAFIIEIVQATGGVAITSAQWHAVVQACRKHRMILVVDEAMTAVRCGAPFAHQLEQYKKCGRPDFAFFGKGVRTCGIAVDWQGINMGELGFTDRNLQVEAINTWQKRFTEVAPPEVLMQSWGTIVLAKKQDWPQRAIRIGDILRDVLRDVSMDPSSIGGLHSLVYFAQSDPGPKSLRIMSASAGPAYTRWLPVLDSVMLSQENTDKKKIGLGSMSHRKQLALYLKRHGWGIRYCCWCGDNMEVGDDREGAREMCEICLTRPCEECEPGEHVCVSQDNDDT